MAKPSNKACPGDYIKHIESGFYGQVVFSFGSPLTYKVMASMFPGANKDYEYVYVPYNLDAHVLNTYSIEEFTIVRKLPKNLY